MSYNNNRITITLSAVEMATIREALRYAAEQVHDSDIPVFESFEPKDMSTGERVFDEALYRANQAKADLAFELADTLDLIEADGWDWTVVNSNASLRTPSFIEVCCHRHKTNDFGMPLVREFIWRYTPKVNWLKPTIRTSILEDCVMPCNTQIAVHREPYDKLTDKSEVAYFTLDDLQNKIPIITGDDDIDEVILGTLRNFFSYSL